MRFRNNPSRFVVPVLCCLFVYLPLGSASVADLNGDRVVDYEDFAVFATHWLEDERPSVGLRWLGHASFKIWCGDTIVYIDPWKLETAVHDGDLILVTHSHSDHYSPTDIDKATGPDAVLVSIASIADNRPGARILLPGETIQIKGLILTGVPAYNTNKSNHPRQNNWLGFVVEIGGRRIYHAGDSDLTPEMVALKDIDVALLPAGGTYTMNAAEAAEAASQMQPRIAIPMHWGDIVGSLSDAQRFAQLATCATRILAKGEMMCSPDWQAQSPVWAYWSLDETEGTTIHDAVGAQTGTLTGTPLWHPDTGVTGGALEFDGSTNSIQTPLSINPGTEVLHISLWVKSGGVDQAILSYAQGPTVLGLNENGLLYTELGMVSSMRSATAALHSGAALAVDQWHLLELVWDGSWRSLHVDDVEIARDPQPVKLGSWPGALRIGGAGLASAGAFWRGWMDEIRVATE